MISKTIVTALLAVASLSLHTAVSAQEDQTVVEISSTKDPELKSYKQIAKGFDIFEKNLALAPLAVLKFKLLSSKADTSLEGTSLRIAGDDISVHIPVEADGSFVLPKIQKALDENADLIVNKKKGSFRWRPDVRTPDLPANMRRLGDLRMECEIRWAVEYEEIPFMTRNLFRLAGGPCHSSNISVSYWPGKKIRAAYLQSGERRIKLYLSSDQRYIAPVHDTSWDDNAMVELEFAEVAIPQAVK